jgi:hypothetical protein
VCVVCRAYGVGKCVLGWAFDVGGVRWVSDGEGLRWLCRLDRKDIGCGVNAGGVSL